MLGLRGMGNRGNKDMEIRINLTLLRDCIQLAKAQNTRCCNENARDFPWEWRFASMSESFPYCY